MAQPKKTPWNMAESNGVVSNLMKSLGIGLPQQGYKPEVHGPYHPGRWYGKPDTNFSDVKLKELPQWFSRRSLNPLDWNRAFWRAAWRWHVTWRLGTKRPSAAFIVQGATFLMLVYYMMGYKVHARERIAKYHW